MNTELDEIVEQDISDDALEFAASVAHAQGNWPTVHFFSTSGCL